MSTFPGSPKILKGGIVVLDPQSSAVLRIIPLQYNPDTLSRSFQIKGVGSEGGDRIEALRLKGPPVETIKVEAEIDATDRLEVADKDDPVLQAGLHPLLSALEGLVYPSSTSIQANNAAASSGNIEIIAASAPLTVFVFGPKRIAPVRITELSITEEAFDVELNPIRAKVSLGMRVLTIDDIAFEERGGGLFMSYLKAKEQLASQSKSGAFAALGIGGLP